MADTFEAQSGAVAQQWFEAHARRIELMKVDGEKLQATRDELRATRLELQSVKAQRGAELDQLAAVTNELNTARTRLDDVTRRTTIEQARLEARLIELQQQISNNEARARTAERRIALANGDASAIVQTVVALEANIASAASDAGDAMTYSWDTARGVEAILDRLPPKAAKRNPIPPPAEEWATPSIYASIDWNDPTTWPTNKVKG